MTSPAEHYARLHAILSGARALQGDALATFLARACGTDQALRARVERLLAAAHDAGIEDRFRDWSVRETRFELERLVAEASRRLLEDAEG